MIEKQEFAGRRERLSEALREHGVDAFLVSALPNIRYLSGFTGSNALLLLTPAGAATLFTDPRYTLQVAEESDCPAMIPRTALTTAAVKLVRRKRWRKIGIERGRIGYGTFLELGEALGGASALAPMPPLVEQQRTVKSPSEIALIRAAVLTNSKACERALRKLKPDTTEGELAAEIDYQMRRLGAEGVAFETIVAAGPRSSLPHATPTAARIGTNRLLLMDTGALQSGYCSDMTRVVHRGKPGAKAKALYRAVLEAQMAALDAVRAGVTAHSVDRAARSVLEAHGFGEAFVHSTGHGLGLEIHEPPRIGRKDKTRLGAGMAITIEPGAYLHGFGGVRIEDTVVVTANGCEILTPTPKELRVL